MSPGPASGGVGGPASGGERGPGPRRGGSRDEPFRAPWEARAFALAVVTVERLGLPWDEFRHRLQAAVAADPSRPYYESWLAALDALVAEHAPTR